MSFDHVSYHSWKTWKFCPYKHKIEKVDGIRIFDVNEYNSFGNAIHEVVERLAEQEQERAKNGGLKDDSLDLSQVFLSSFEEKIKDIPEDKKRFDLIAEMKEQGKELAQLVFPAMKEYFGDFVFVASEQELKVRLKSFKNQNIDFQGYIDLIIQTTRRPEISYC